MAAVNALLSKEAYRERTGGAVLSDVVDFETRFRGAVGQVGVRVGVGAERVAAA